MGAGWPVGPEARRGTARVADPQPFTARTSKVVCRAWIALVLLSACASGAAGRGSGELVSGGGVGQLAREGLSTWEWGSGAAAAKPLLEEAIRRNPGDAAARVGLMLLARRRLDDRAELSEALELLERSPDRPEARLAALAVQRLAGTSTELDPRILIVLAAVDRDRVDPVVAQRLAETQAELLVARGEFDAADQVRAAAGLVQSWSVVGPLSSYHWLEFDRPLEPSASDKAAQPAVSPRSEAKGTRSPDPASAKELARSGREDVHDLVQRTELGLEWDPAPPSFGTPWGSEGWRDLRFFNGWVPLGHDMESRQPPAGESRPAPPNGDIYYARTKVQAGVRGLRLRVESTASVRVFVDGQTVLERDRFRRQLGRASWVTVPATPGAHSLWVEAAAGDAGGGFRIDAPPLRDSLAGDPVDADSLAAELAADVGPALGALLAAEDVGADDPAAALRLLERVPEEVGGRLSDGSAKARARAASSTHDPGPLELSLRADLWGALGTLGDEEAHGRARRDLDALIALDPADGSARLRRAGLELGLGRYEAAQADLGAAGVPAPVRVEVAAARLSMAEDASALAQPHLRRALAADPGNCAALELEESLFDQVGAAARLDRVADELARCPGGRETSVEIRSRRVGPSPLIHYWRGRLERSPSDPRAAERLAEALVAAGRFEAASEALRQRLAAWPEDVDGWRRLGTLRAQMGDEAGARTAWRRALAIDPSDLPLRRGLALLEGRDVLDGVLPDAAAALAGPAWIGPARAPLATLLDSGAAWFHRDGSVTERVRTIERIVDESGLTQAGELELPAGAQLLAFRTHKPDGTILDAEAAGSGDKRTISAAALGVGDDLEIEYLLSTPPDRRGQGGAAEPFYFQAGDSSLQRSIYVVRSEAAASGKAGRLGDSPPVFDAHRIEVPPVRPWPGQVTIERREVPALVSEPGAPPEAEYLPWVQAGVGGETLADLARSIADQLAPRTVVDGGVRALAEAARRAAAQGGPGPGQTTLARSLWQVVSERIRGSGGTLAEDASAIVARGEGDRLLPMRAALSALGIRSTVVLASGPQASTEPRRFPRLADYTDALLEIEPDDGPPRWLDPAVRYAPFGRLPPWLCGRPALPLPEAPRGGTENPAMILPACRAGLGVAEGPDDHSFHFVLSIRPDGGLEGEGQEILGGFEAAAARATLDQLDDVQRRQAVEAALAAGFRGASLKDARFEVQGKGGEPKVELRYRFSADDFARPEGDSPGTGEMSRSDRGGPPPAEEAAPGGARRWSVPLRAFAVNLGDRYLQLASRNLPLAITSWQRPVFELDLRLPSGASVSEAAPAAVALETPFGSYARSEKRSAGSVQLHERLLLPPQRVAPGRYPDFAAFAAAVDRAEDERLVFTLPRTK